MKARVNTRPISRFLLLAAAVAVSGTAGSATEPRPEASRTFDLQEEIVLNFPVAAKFARIWIPLASSDDHQTVELKDVTSAVPTRRTTDPEYGNESLYVEVPDPSRRDVRFRLVFRAIRREYSAWPGSGAASPAAKPAGTSAVISEPTGSFRSTGSSVEEYCR